MHLYPFWIRFYTNASFDLWADPFISSYVASPLIQARALEQLGATLPDSLHKQFCLSQVLCFLFLEGKKKVMEREEPFVLPHLRREGTDSRVSDFYSTPFSYRCCLNIYTPYFFQATSLVWGDRLWNMKCYCKASFLKVCSTENSSATHLEKSPAEITAPINILNVLISPAAQGNVHIWPSQALFSKFIRT